MWVVSNNASVGERDALALGSSVIVATMAAAPIVRFGFGVLDESTPSVVVSAIRQCRKSREPAWLGLAMELES